MEHLDVQNKPVQKKGLYIDLKEPLNPIIVIETEEDYRRFCEEGRTQDYFSITDPLKFARVFKKSAEEMQQSLTYFAGSPAATEAKKRIEKAGANYATLLDYLEKIGGEVLSE